MIFALPSRTIICFTVAAISLAPFVGCGGADSGPTRYQMTGQVNYDGKPVPKGTVTFEPDTTKGNSGPGSGAAIENGRYDTGTENGPVAGPHTVRIVGYDGVPASMEGESMPDGKSLFAPYEGTFDVPKESSEKDFDIPKSGP